MKKKDIINDDIVKKDIVDKKELKMIKKARKAEARIKNGIFAIDSSAEVYLASLSKGYSNTFRVELYLSEDVDAVSLQKAVDCVYKRFPTMVSSIRKGIFKYYLVPLSESLEIAKDEECLEPMTIESIYRCAMRILYKDNRVALEVFHSLTDGSGAIVFLRTLMAQYFSIKYGIDIEYSKDILNPAEDVNIAEVTDDYKTYASKKSAKASKEAVYQIPVVFDKDDKTVIISRKYKTSDLIAASREHGTSLTTFLTAIMSETILGMQNDTNELKIKHKQKSDKVQILVPINLRKKFMSETLQNFILYALPYVDKGDKDKTLDQLISKLSGQLNEQFSKEYLGEIMGRNHKSQNVFIYKYLPIILRKRVLSIIYRLFGERNSTISISNFGEITLPDNMKEYVQGARCILSPRRTAAYNCSLVSCNGYTYIDVSRKGVGCGLEDVFFNKIEEYAMVA